MKVGDGSGVAVGSSGAMVGVGEGRGVSVSVGRAVGVEEGCRVGVAELNWTGCTVGVGRTALREAVNGRPVRLQANNQKTKIGQISFLRIQKSSPQLE